MKEYTWPQAIAEGFLFGCQNCGRIYKQQLWADRHAFVKEHRMRPVEWFIEHGFT